MENYTITKEQILELHESNSYEIRIQIAKMFPYAFKKELEVGKWYKRPHNSALFYVTEILNIDSNHCKVFGFDNLGNWMAENAKTFPDNDFEATPKQVETALINQSKKLGIKEGVFVSRNLMHANTDNITLLKGEKYFYDFNFDILYLNEKEIYSNGVFAKVIPEETKVITMDKAVKILSKKYGKQVEIK